MMWLRQFSSLAYGRCFPIRPPKARCRKRKHFVVDIISINGEEFVVKDENGKEATIHCGDRNREIRSAAGW